MHAIACALTSTQTTSLRCVKNSTVYDTYFLKHWKEENERAKNFHVWHPNKRKFSVWSEYYNQFGIYQPSCVSLLKPHHLSNLSNPEAYSEFCQISKVECFAKKKLLKTPS